MACNVLSNYIKRGVSMICTHDSARPLSPVIGIVSSILVMETGPFPGMERSFVNHDYIAAIEAAGGIPLMLPVVKNEEAIRRQLELVDALILPGGYDPNPLLYGENPCRTIGYIFPEVDDHQMTAIRIADASGIPMLGICRGLQILNVAFGGTLHQDVSLAPDSYVQHSQKSRRHSPGHDILLEQGSMLKQVFGVEKMTTNSFHHLAVKNLAPGFSIGARAVDGIIEGIERESGTPVIAVQWHPEMMFEKHPAMLRLFQAFMNMAVTSPRYGKPTETAREYCS